MFNIFRRKPKASQEIMEVVNATTCVVSNGMMYVRCGYEIVSKPVMRDTIARQHVALFASASPENLRIAQALAIAEGIATPDDFATPQKPSFFSLN